MSLGNICDNFAYYKNFRKQFIKDVDTWTERIFCDEPGCIIAYTLTNLIKTEKLPYLLTTITFVVRLFSASLFFIGQYLFGAILFYVSMILDCADGICSRAIFGEDTVLRGFMDVFFDNLSLIILLYVVAIREPSFVYLILIIALIYYLYEFGVATQYLLFPKLNKPIGTSVFEAQSKQSKLAHKLYLKVRESFMKKGMIFYPTVVDAEFLMFVILPLFSFKSILILEIAILCVFIHAFFTLGAVFANILNQQKYAQA